MDLLKSFFAVLRWVEASTILLLAIRVAPVATKTFVNSIRVAFSVINSPCFLFVVGNGIVLLLFFKYRNLNDDDVNTTNDNNDSYNSEAYNGIIGFLPPSVKPVQEEEEKKQEPVYEDKEVVSTDVHHERTCRRSKSERKMSSSPKIRELKRSMTDMASEDDSDEFRRTIEAFIEKQLKFQREESKSISMEMPTDTLAIVSAAAPPDEGKEKE